MRETKFIEQNREKWAEFEAMLNENRRDPEKLNDLFIQITDDLSYARTFYPNRSVRMYLNRLAQRVFHNIYRGKRFPARRFRLFWTDELPRLMWESRYALLLSFCLFTLAAGIGVVSSMLNPDFARVILGDDYVEMTLSNIERNDPMAVYKESRPLGMSVGIAANNLFVAFRTAIFGVLASIGTVFILMYNGIMLGAFQYFFIERGLFWESFLTIWIHGTLEISAIIIAGAAGLVAGSGLLFPGTYTRGQAFQISTRRGLKIFIGLIPMFLLAAFFEGYFTRFTDTPAPVRFIFILSSLAFVLWYFVWLPWHKSRAGFHPDIVVRELPPAREQALSFTVIKGAGELFSDVFSLLSRGSRSAWLGITLTAAAFTGISAFAEQMGSGVAFVFPDYPTGAFQGWWDLLGRNRAPVIFWSQAALFWSLFWMAAYLINRAMPESFRDRWRTRPRPAALALTALLSVALAGFIEAVESGFLLWIVGMLAFPFLSLWMATACFEGKFWTSLPRAWNLARWGQGSILGFLILNFGLLLALFVDSPVWDMFLQFFSWLMPPQESAMQRFLNYATAFAISFVIHFVWMLLVCSGMLQYFSCREILDAVHLREGIAQVGATRRIRGLAKE